MSISVFDLFSIGIGPSSSHTVGPMKAAYDFISHCNNLADITRVQITLHGSLAHTGRGHMTHHALLMGLEGERPHLINPDTISQRIQTILKNQTIKLLNQQPIHFHFNQDLIFDLNTTLPHHPNAMQFVALDNNNHIVAKEVYYSVGGGFIEKEGPAPTAATTPRYSFSTTEELLLLCHTHQLTMAEIMLENERAFRTDSQTNRRLQQIETIMMECIDKGCLATDSEPQQLLVRRRAPEIYQKIMEYGPPQAGHPHPMNCLNTFAIAASEQNAIGGRIVTAPTNGAAGIIPALIKYHRCFDPNASDQSVRRFLLTAGAICLLYKYNASISGAEMGCQGEIGVACSIAAAGLTAARNGSLFQIENAAEIGIEHNLGLTCDPVGGLVQIPCIERNAMGAVKAVNASSLALISEKRGKVTLDMAIKTMRDIGHDMKSIYKETSLGGLAVNVPEC